MEGSARTGYVDWMDTNLGFFAGLCGSGSGSKSTWGIWVCGSRSGGGIGRGGKGVLGIRRSGLGRSVYGALGLGLISKSSAEAMP